MFSVLSRLLINTIKPISEDIPVPKVKNSKWPPDPWAENGKLISFSIIYRHVTYQNAQNF